MLFRAARHTDDLEPVIAFYTTILGLEELGSFTDHDGYDGVFLGKTGQDWHLEFTTSATKANHTFDADDIWVFYPEHVEEYESIRERIRINGIQEIEPENPYWSRNGIMIQDPDGHRVVISDFRM